MSVFLPPLARGSRMAMVILVLTAMGLIISGLVFGIVALRATKRHGRAGIFGRALAGTCINGLLVLLMLAAIPVWMQAAERAKAKQKYLMEQNQLLEQGR